MADIDNNAIRNTPSGQSREWNYHPTLPIVLAPFFDLPPRPKATIKWLINTWFKVTPPVNHLICALIVYAFFWPTLASMQELKWGWMVQIFIINFSAVLLLAGTLHAYLYIYAGQKTRLKFDIRPMEKSIRFKFNNQVWDNVFWSLVSGVPIWSAWTILYFYVAANDWVPVVKSFNESPVWFIFFFFIIRFWQSFHFYWIHRLIHFPWLFKNVHYLHHRNVNVGPWSGLSMHPFEHLLYYSSILIHFVLPSNPLHVIFHMFALNLGAVLSHAGFDKLLFKDKEAAKAGSFFHQLHHRYFECNYGSEEIPLDRWFASFHDGTDEATKRIRARKKLIFSPK